MIRLLRVGGMQRTFSTISVKNACGGRSTGTSAVPQISDDFGAPRESAEVGQRLPLPIRLIFQNRAIEKTGKTFQSGANQLAVFVVGTHPSQFAALSESLASLRQMFVRLS
jgi:hypothetical protein